MQAVSAACFARCVSSQISECATPLGRDEIDADLLEAVQAVSGTREVTPAPVSACACAPFHLYRKYACGFQLLHAFLLTRRELPNV